MQDNQANSLREYLEKWYANSDGSLPSAEALAEDFRHDPNFLTIARTGPHLDMEFGKPILQVVREVLPREAGSDGEAEVIAAAVKLAISSSFARFVHRLGNRSTGRQTHPALLDRVGTSGASS